MKRTLDGLAVWALLAALAGWGAAWQQARVLQRTADQDLRTAPEQRLAARFAEQVLSSDEAVIVSQGVAGGEERRIRDPAWLVRVAAILGGSSYRPMGIGLWISNREIRLRREGEPVLGLTLLPGILRVFSEGTFEDFLVPETTTTSLAQLMANVP